MSAPSSNSAFVGSIPQNYDQHLGPALFEPYAKDVAGRVPWREGLTVLEIAAGTGIVSRHLAERLPAGAKLTVTDLNGDMLEVAKRKIPATPSVEWQVADALSLPFDDGSFDVVVCQFGYMFFPDKLAGMREAFRVLRSGGTLLLSVWDTLERNEFSVVVRDVVSDYFEKDPPTFFNIPFGSSDTDALRQVLSEAGFENIRFERVEKESVSESASGFATGLAQGSPLYGFINERDPSAADALTQRAADALRDRFGGDPIRGKMSAFVFQATKP